MARGPICIGKMMPKKTDINRFAKEKWSQKTPTNSEIAFDEMSDATALEVAARIAETAAFNLATELGPDEAAQLIVISHQINQVLERLNSSGLPSHLPAARLH